MRVGRTRLPPPAGGACPLPPAGGSHRPAAAGVDVPPL